MDKSARNDLVEYWKASSEDNFRSMLNMYASGEYVWCLFVGHLCIEKLLKAIYVKNVDTTVPRTHNLLKLAVSCDLKMTEEQADSLQYVTIFNIEARYEEHKREFYRKCTKATLKTRYRP